MQATMSKLKGWRAKALKPDTSSGGCGLVNLVSRPVEGLKKLPQVFLHQSDFPHDIYQSALLLQKKTFNLTCCLS